MPEDSLYPSLPQISKIVNLTANATASVNMLGGLVILNGYTLNVAALSSTFFGAIYVAGEGDLAGSVVEAVAADSIIMLAFGGGEIFSMKASSIPGLQAILDAKVNTSQIGTSEGDIPVLGAGGKLAASLLPGIAVDYILPVANEAARLALTSAQATGKLVRQIDNGRSYGLIENGDPSDTGDWLELGDSEIEIADVAGLTAALAAKETPAGAAAQIAAALKGVIVTKSNGTRTAYAPSADTDTARGHALEAAFAAAVTGGTIDLSPGNYLITKKYEGILVAGKRVIFEIKNGMTVRLNGARLYVPPVVTVAHNALVVGRWYIITGNAGSTANWVSVGAASNNGGNTFQATGTAVSSGSGVVIEPPMAMFCPGYSSGVIPAIDWSILGPGKIEGDATTTVYTAGDPHGYNNQTGIDVAASRRWRIDGISFMKHRHAGLLLNTPSWTNETSYTVKTSTGHVSNCNFDFNNNGVVAWTQNEYTQFTNCQFNQNVIGVDLYAGNTNFVACNASANTTCALKLRNGVNDGHGSWIGGHITHNSGFSIDAEASMDLGFLFSGCTIAGDSTTTGKIQSLGGGLNFVGCYIEAPFFASATPTGLNTVANCTIYGTYTAVTDLSAAERLKWAFLDNHTLTGGWANNDDTIYSFADNTAALAGGLTAGRRYRNSITNAVAVVI